jgi:hypothetical protein
MNKTLKTLLGGSLLLMLPFALNATVIVNDTFDVGATPTIGDDVDDSLDVAWVGGYNNTSVTVSTSGALLAPNYLLNDASSGFSMIRASLPANPLLNLSLGSTVNLTFDFVYATNPDSDDNGLRFGLFDAAGYGTVVNAGTSGTNTILTIVHDTGSGINADMGSGGGGADPFSGASDVVTAGTMSSSLGTTAVSALLSITRTDASTLNLSVSLNGGTASVIDVDDAGDAADYLSNFSSGYIMIRSANPKQDFAIDNVQLEVVPEPSTIALVLGSLCLGFVLLRRRVRQ